MLSLPLIIPRDESPLWPSAPSTSVSSTVDSPYPSANHNATQPNSPPSRSPPPNRLYSHSSTSLSLLTSDEAAILQRKENIRRFGAGWIRPPGISKTYQAMQDEIAEREEQELTARREQALSELAAAQEAEAERERLAGMGAEGEEAERDLDEDIPDADAEADAEADLDDDIPDADADEEDEEEVDLDAEIESAASLTFNEESLIEGSFVHGGEGDASAPLIDQDDYVQGYLSLEEAELNGRLQDERDLDDDVPEAGSYQHTDTEVEDEDSSGFLGESMFGTRAPSVARTSQVRPRLSGGRQAPARTLQWEGREVVGRTSELFGESSEEESSPVGRGITRLAGSQRGRGQNQRPPEWS